MNIELIESDFIKGTVYDLVYEGRDIGTVTRKSTSSTGGDFSVTIRVELRIEDLGLTGLRARHLGRFILSNELEDFLSNHVWESWGSCGHQHDCCGCVIYRQPSSWTEKAGVFIEAEQSGVRNV